MAECCLRFPIKVFPPRAILPNATADCPELLPRPKAHHAASECSPPILRQRLKTLFDLAVLESDMNVSSTHTPARLHKLPDGGQQRVQFFVFLIHRDRSATGDLRCRMQLARTGRHFVVQLGQLTGRFDRPLFALAAILRLLSFPRLTERSGRRVAFSDSWLTGSAAVLLLALRSMRISEEARRP